jgi:hypothetical protein
MWGARREPSAVIEEITDVKKKGKQAAAEESDSEDEDDEDEGERLCLEVGCVRDACGEVQLPAW